MNFGDWPAWIALIVAILSPLLTTIINNRHQREMLSLERKYERAKSCDKLIAELTALTSLPLLAYDGFTKEAFEATRYLKKETFDIFMQLLIDLTKSAVPQLATVYETINDIPLYILPEESNPTKRKCSHYIDIASLIINELRDAT